MSTRLSAVQHTEDGLILRLCIQTRASKDEIIGAYGDCIKIRITAPPVDGKANQHLLRYLARHFGVPQNQVVLISGESSKGKKVRITRPTKIPDAINM